MIIVNNILSHFCDYPASDLQSVCSGLKRNVMFILKPYSDKTDLGLIIKKVISRATKPFITNMIQFIQITSLIKFYIYHLVYS